MNFIQKIVGILLIIVFGIAFVSTASEIGAPWYIAALGVLFVMLGILGILKGR